MWFVFSNLSYFRGFLCVLVLVVFAVCVARLVRLVRLTFQCGSSRPRVRLGPLDTLVSRVPVVPQVFRTSFRMLFSVCGFGV